MNRRYLIVAELDDAGPVCAPFEELDGFMGRTAREEHVLMQLVRAAPDLHVVHVSEVSSVDVTL